MKELSDIKEIPKLKEKFKLAWYFESTLEKILLILCMISFVYSILRIIAQGWW